MKQANRRGGAKSLAGGLLCCLLLLTAGTALADDPDSGESGQPSGWDIAGWSLQTSVYTKHWDPDPDHVNDQNLIGLELFFANKYLTGLAVFDNSFGQNSQYLYFGRAWQLFHSRFWYFKLTGGLLHGYKDEYKDKIPLNQMGIAPAIVPSLGFRYKYFVTEAHMGGTAVVTITAGLRF